MPNLDDVCRSMEEFRNIRQCPASPVPIRLRADVLALLEEYSSSQLAQALGIQQSTISKWRKADTLVSSGDPFVELPNASELLNDLKDNNCCIEFSRADGSMMRIVGAVRLTEINQIIQGFLGGNYSC